jgi:hypothetical protein
VSVSCSPRLEDSPGYRSQVRVAMQVGKVERKAPDGVAAALIPRSRMRRGGVQPAMLSHVRLAVMADLPRTLPASRSPMAWATRSSG